MDCHNRCQDEKCWVRECCHHLHPAYAKIERDNYMRDIAAMKKRERKYD